MGQKDGEKPGSRSGAIVRVSSASTHLPDVANRAIGDHLVRAGLFDAETLEAVTEEVSRTGDSFFQTLRKMGVVASSDLVNFLAQTYRMNVVDLSRIDPPDDDALRQVPQEYLTQHGMLLISLHGKRAIVAVSDPSKLGPIDDLRFSTSWQIETVVGDAEEISRVGRQFYSRLTGLDAEASLEQGFEQTDDSEVSRAEAEVVDEENLERVSDEAPVIRVVNLLLSEAGRRGASDIHIETSEKLLRIRLRIDGMLHELMRPSYKLRHAIVSRIKLIAGLDITERRMPQDGQVRLKFTSGRVCDFRVSVMPFRHGEKVVIRILDASSLQTDMTRLGLDEGELTLLRRAIHQSNGLVLVTGPTGSGKTTTLYSALTELNQGSVNISTVEDPVEIDLPGTNQCQVNAEIGLTFSHVLRSLLRQDPDIIMVGEIRDFETAEIAVQAALTGHLVLSTLHTNDASSTITRLTTMGVDAHVLADALRLILAQRLVRKTCLHCRRAFIWEKTACLDAGMSEEEYADGQTMKGMGCQECSQTGYKGRVAVYEFLRVTKKMRDAILDGRNASDLERTAVNEGMHTLRKSALKKFAQGLTTLEEVLRVTRAD